MPSSQQTAQNVEAKTVALLVRNASNFTIIDHHKWLLKRLFQPLGPETDNIQVLHISNAPLASLIQNERKATKKYTLQDFPALIPDKNYKLMPHSRIFTLNTKYRFVFLLDVTSSLATIDCSNTEDKVKSEVMRTACRCIEGLVQPFIFQDLDKDMALQFEPEISITVIAECSNFASNANLIPMLADFPTMRVLLQGVVVNKNNVSDIINNLQSEFSDFQHEVVAFRQQLRRTKAPSKYVMEVEPEPNSSGKNLWRLGSSGSNLAYSLNAGLFAVNLMPNEGFPALVVITDGVVNSSLVQMSSDDDIIQQLCKEGIRCNIIKIGPRENFTFGLLPDNEILEFVATATSGVFLYSTDCPDVHEVKSTNVPLSYNFYHQHLLWKETCFSKRKSTSSHQMFEDNFNFPWDPRGQPPGVEAMPTRYREYSLSIDTMQLIFARMRNGFVIESIVLAMSRNAHETEKKVHITMTRFWQPNVTIQYKIKGLWMGEVYGFSALKSPRIEINVVADTLLTIYLINYQKAQQNNDPSHPLFLKCSRLHKFVMMICETDELLKKHVFQSKKSPLYHAVEVAGFKSSSGNLWNLWNSFERDPMRRNTNNWYDEVKFDILISEEQSTVDLPVNISSDNRQNKNAYLVLRKLLKNAWSSIAYSDEVYIKTLGPIVGDKLLPISFCELRINNESGNLITGNLLFFNVEVARRQQELEALIKMIDKLNQNELDKSQLYICKKSLSSFLIRNSLTSHHGSGISLDHHHVTGRSCIVESYLRHWEWNWLSDIEHSNIPVQDLALQAFQHLCQARLDERSLLISESNNQKVFYRELELKGDSDIDPSVNQTRLYGVQYHIFKDSAGKITTELWMEPSQQPFLRELYKSVANRISEADRRMLSLLVTFDQIHYIAKTHNLSLPKSSHLPSLFNLPVLLKSSGLLIANYNIPSFTSSSKVNLQPVKSSSALKNEAAGYEDSKSSESSPYIRKGSISNRNPSHVEAIQQKKLSLSLPKNPTNNVIYIIDRGSIASLSPLDLDFALLYLFFEKTLTNHVDGEVDTNDDNNGLKDSILKEINVGLAKSDIFQEASTTITYISNLRESRCFIKIVDPNSFLLIIIPSFKVILDTMKQNHGFQVDNKACFMSIIIFLCKGAQLIRCDSINNSLDFSRLSFETISLFHKDATPVKNSLEPRLLGSPFPENFFTSDLSDQATRVTLNITKLYSHGFVKSVYASVLQKNKVTKTDFYKAINTCTEFSVDIDITGYVNVHVNAGSDSDDVNDVYQKFVSVLGYYFEPANFDGDELQYVYYYRPNLRKPPPDSENATDSFLDIFNYADNPLFLRLECTFRKQTKNKSHSHVDNGHDSGVPEEPNVVKFPVSSLPTSYLCTVDGKDYDFSPESVGTGVSPIESSDGTTATLHLICLTLPRADNEVVEIGQSSIDLRTNDDVTSTSKNTKESFYSLTFDKQEALEETRSRIDWLLREEIMHGLLKPQERVKELALAYVQEQLKRKNPFVDFPNTFNFPLSFVHREKGQERFLKEFSKTDMSPYSLNRAEGCFYISLDEEMNESLDVDDHLSEPNIDSRPMSPDGMYGYEDDFGHGLGISFSSLEEKKDIPVKPVKRHIVHKQLFWLLLIPQENSIQMYFYSKAVSAIERSNIIKHVRNCIIKISEKVNRLVLLDELHMSRDCSEYLVPLDGESSGGEFSNLVDVLSMAPTDGSAIRFRPGQFKCQSVYKRSFPLHWRVKQNDALNGIASLLDPCVVHNRKDMFVIEDGDDIFYLKTTEIKSPDYFETDEQRRHRELVVEVFGLETPSAGITEKLMENIETRLISHVTLVAVCTILNRKLRFSPTRADVDFFLPILKNPYRLSLKIPSYIRNVYSFLDYFKQNISSYLSIFQGSEVTDTIERHYNLNYGTPKSVLESVRETPKTYCFQPHEFVFFYFNIGKPRKGEGIAGLCFTLLNRQGQPVFDLSVPDTVDSNDIDLNSVLKRISNDKEFIVSDLDGNITDIIDTPYRLFIELWYHGALDHEGLLNRISKSFRQTFCDYFIEALITKGLRCTSLDNVEDNPTKVTQNLDLDDQKGINEYAESHAQHNFVEPVLELLKTAFDLGNPVIHRLSRKLDIPSWIMDYFLSEVYELLVEVHDAFTPVILRTIPTALKPTYEIYQPRHSISTVYESISVQNQRQYLLIAGLKEMNAKYSSYKPDDHMHSRRDSIEDISKEKPKLQKNSRPIEDFMIYDRNTFDLFRSCFLVMSISGFDLSVYTYNWKQNFSEKAFAAMKKIFDWHNNRIDLLDNIHHQKMGLFHHAVIKAQPQTRNVTQGGQTDLIYIDSLIHERFPQRESKKNPEARHEYSAELEANQFTLTSSDLNGILKDSCVEEVVARDSVSRDALMRYGPPFMKTCLRQAKIIRAHDNAERVFKKWAKRCQGHEEDHLDTNEVIEKSELAIILHTSRLLHFCRTPLLFGEKVVSITTPDQKDKTVIYKWYKDMIETFFQEYSTKLEKLGMQVVMGGKPGLMLVNDGDKVFYTSEFSAQDSPAVFLLKELQGGSILCEIRIQEGFVCVALHTLNNGRRYKAVSGDAEVDRHNLSVFTEECGRFKTMIHINSFVYDFHLKHIKHVLESPDNQPSFNVLETLRAFVHRHSQPAYCAAHRIYPGTFNKEFPSAPKDLFEYIITNPQRYGFSPICYDAKPIACFSTLNVTNASVESDTEQWNKIVYDNETQITLIFTKENQSDKSDFRKISLEYFAIDLHNDDTETPNKAKNNIISTIDHSLDSVISKAIQYHRRDLLWRALVNSSAISVQDFLELKNQWDSRELITIYPDFKEFLNINLNWTELLSFLLGYYRASSRELYEENHTYHLIILNSHTSDLLLHFILSSPKKDDEAEQDSNKYNNSDNVVANIVRREAHDFKELEMQFAADLARTIGYWLWKKLTNH